MWGLLRMIYSFSSNTVRREFSVCILLMVVFTANVSYAQTRAPVPSAEKQKEIAKLLEDGYELTRLDTATKKQEALVRLMEAAEDRNLGADERYGVLTTAISLASQAGQPDEYLKCVNTLVASFEVDAGKEKIRFLTEFLKISKPGAQVKPIVEEAIEVAQAAAQEHQFSEALSLLGAVDVVLRRAAEGASQKSLVADARAAITAREKEWKAYQAAKTKLETKPDDPAANLAMGRWHLLEDAGWDQALSFLVKAGDAKWKAAAVLEQSRPTDAMAQVAVGDAWWDIGQKESGVVKSAILAHAADWYERALPDLASALKKQVVSKRIDEVATLRNSTIEPAHKQVPSGTSNKTDWVDLLEWTEGADWTGKGINWNEQLATPPLRKGVRLAKGNSVKFPLVAIIDGNYEMDVVFTRHEGSGDVAIYFPVGIHTMRMLLSSDGGAVSRLDFINGKLALEHVPGTLSNGQPHRVLIRVTHDGEKASIGVDFDETKNYFKWDGPYSSLVDVDNGKWKTTSLQHAWVGSFANPNLVFQKVNVRMLSGTIVRDSITAADQEKDLKSGFVRLVGKKPLSAQAFEGNFAINQYLELPPLVGQEWPRVSRDFKYCDDYYGAHAPSRLKCPIPPGAKSFSVVGYNCASGSTKTRILVDGQPTHESRENVDLIKIDLSPTAKLLELVVDPDGSNFSDHLYWCYPRFHTVKSDLITEKMIDGESGPLRFNIESGEIMSKPAVANHNRPMVKAAPIHFRDTQLCHEFIYAHAPSAVSFAVPSGMTRFTAVGWATVSNTVKFEVWADGSRIYQSPEVGIAQIDVKLPARTAKIELKIDDLGDYRYDHTFWCYPRLHRK